MNRSVCWRPTWNGSGAGLEHVLLRSRSAESTLLALSEGGAPFQLCYRLAWDDAWRLRQADLRATSARFDRSLALRADGEGRWSDADGRHIERLDGCLDIDIWPTPFTNTFPLRRERFALGERREFRMAWVLAPQLSFKAQPQAYTRLADRTYLFENLDGTGFRAKLPVDRDKLVIDYPKLFRRVPRPT